MTEVRVEGNRYLAAETILREFSLREGDRFSFAEALSYLDHLTGSGLLTGAWMDLIPDGDAGVRMVLQVTEEYRHTVDVGLAFQTDHQAQGFIRMETRDLLRHGERLQLHGYVSARDLIVGFRLHGDQPFGTHVGYQLDLEHWRERPKVYVKGNSVNRAEFRRLNGQLAVNLPFSLDSLLQLGVRAGETEIRERLGLDLPASQYQNRVLLLRYIRDDLNATVVPREGSRFSILAERNEEALGGTTSYFRIQTEGRVVLPLGGVTGQFRAFHGFSSGDLPIQEWFRLGGPDMVPGLAREEIWGRHAVAASLSLGFDTFSIVRLGIRVGAGNVWNDLADVSPTDVIFGAGLGFTITTPIGPIKADYGWGEGGRNRFYFSIGWQ